MEIHDDQPWCLYSNQRRTAVNQKATIRKDAAVVLSEMVEQIDSREAFVTFLRTLFHDLKQRPGEWGNHDLASFLEAMAAWVEDMDGYFQNQEGNVPDQPTWKTLGQILLAARVYE
jgi:hypothetical protein